MQSASVAPVSRLSLLSFAATCAVALLAPRTLAQEGGSKGDAKVDFVKQVKPLLEQRCFNCHGGKRTEGELDMTSKASLFHDDEVMWSVVPGDHAMSPVYERVALPAGDPDLMPEDGPPLSAEQIAVLKRWIDEGADWPEGVTLKGEAPPPVDVIEVPAMDDATGLVIAAALESLRERGAVAQTIAVDTQAVDVNLSILGDKAGDDQVLALANLGPALAWLNLSRTAVTDKGMAVLTRLPHLRRLHLAQTAVGDGGLVHAAELKALQYLNLYGSKVTDAGLVHLHGLSDLRKLYLWQTAVTDEGVAALKGALPNLHVDRGDYLPAAAKPNPEPTNDRCPVTDKELDPATKGQFAVLHEGQWIGFCCAKCRGAFEADPKKFADKLPAAAAIQPLNDVCPVSGQPADAGVTVEDPLPGGGGVRLVAFCCTKCRAAFVADPAKFRAKLDGAPELGPELNDVCPVSNQPVKAQIFVDHDGLRIAFCCDKCKAKFVAAPDGFMKRLEHPGRKGSPEKGAEKGS